MDMNNSNSGVVRERMTPLIGFDTIVDIDFGLTVLIREQYFDTKVFDKSFFDKDSQQLISALYSRDDINPLYIMAKKDIDRELLDQYYGEFLGTKRMDIYQRSITTNVLLMIETFIAAQIIPFILCYNEDQRKIIADETSIAGAKIISLSEIEDKSEFDQFFLKNVDELEHFKEVKRKSFYISSYGPNIDERNHDLINSDLVNLIIKNRNNLSVFDLYNEKYLK